MGLRKLQIATYLRIASISLLMVLIAFQATALAQSPESSNQEQTPATQQPDIENSVCQGANLRFPDGPISGNECSFSESQPEDKLNDIVATIVNLFSVVVGVVAVIMIIVGGFRYITSGGDSANVGTAKNTILYAIVGLIIVALAQFIVKFVLARAVGAET